jgi:ABC-2 type transport system permease protein
MRNFMIIFRRELFGYFNTPLAYIFIFIFLVMAGILTFEVGGFYEREMADLNAFFLFHPVLYLLFIPAISMRLWSEERKTGSIELLLTLPISLFQAVMGKFMAAWAFTGIALALTFPIWMTVNFLGSPDNGVILGAYMGSLLMAGSLLAIGSCVSGTTKNQVVSFIVSIVICMILVMSGHPMILKFFPGALFALLGTIATGCLIWGSISEHRSVVLASALLLVASIGGGLALWFDLFNDQVSLQINQAIATLSLYTHYENLAKGIVDIRDILYFISMIGVWLYVNTVIIEMKKAS